MYYLCTDLKIKSYNRIKDPVLKNIPLNTHTQLIGHWGV